MKNGSSGGGGGGGADDASTTRRDSVQRLDAYLARVGAEARNTEGGASRWLRKLERLDAEAASTQRSSSAASRRGAGAATRRSSSARSLASSRRSAAAAAPGPSPSGGRLRRPSSSVSLAEYFARHGGAAAIATQTGASLVGASGHGSSVSSFPSFVVGDRLARQRVRGGGGGGHGGAREEEAWHWASRHAAEGVRKFSGKQTRARRRARHRWRAQIHRWRAQIVCSACATKTFFFGSSLQSFAPRQDW